MYREVKAYVAAAAVLLLMIGPGRAAPALTLGPQGTGLETTLLTADALRLGDYAKITMSDGGTRFLDVGYLPVEGFSLGGRAFSPPGFAAPGGSGWGAYFQYTARGTQTFSASGLPDAATYSQLDYRLIGYEGSATFKFDAAGDPIVGGTVLQSAVLGEGSLIDGMLAFVPASTAGLTIEGAVSATFNPAVPQLATLNPAVLTLSIDHPPGDWNFTSSSTIQIAAASGATAALQPFSMGTGLGEQSDPPDPPAPIPEPASALVIGAALIGIGVGRRQRRRRSSNAA